jgi:hypothetical protein
VLDYGLQYEGLLDGAVMGAETCLGRCVEFQGIRYPGKALVYGRHEQFRERRCYRDAPVAVWLAFVAFSFIYWLYF